MIQLMIQLMIRTVKVRVGAEEGVSVLDVRRMVAGTFHTVTLLHYSNEWLCYSARLAFAPPKPSAPRFASPRFASLRFASPRFASLRFASLRLTSLHLASLRFADRHSILFQQ